MDPELTVTAGEPPMATVGSTYKRGVRAAGHRRALRRRWGVRAVLLDCRAFPVSRGHSSPRSGHPLIAGRGEAGSQIGLLDSLPAPPVEWVLSGIGTRRSDGRSAAH